MLGEVILLEVALQIFLSLVTVIATGVISWIVHKIKKRGDIREAAEQQRAVDILIREKATNEALRALCRDRILQGYRYYRQQGGVSTADLETMTKLYNAYHSLGGNGTISAVYDKICSLPIKEGV